MSRRLWPVSCFVLALALALLPAKAAQAHPLGNFTVNHYSQIEFADEEAQLTYILDFAEIPTLQQMSQLDTDGDGELSAREAEAYLDAEVPEITENLRLTVGGEALPLRVSERSAEFVPGEGDLPTLRVEVRLAADLPGGWENEAGYYTNDNYEERLGWREIVTRGGPGVVVEDSTAPETGISDELRSYPEDMLLSPLDDREATFALAAGDGTVVDDTTGLAGTVGAGGMTDRAAELISTENLSPTVVAVSLMAALFWGGAHALTPGHGKAVVAAYLIGARGTSRHAGFLGLTVTLTHTVGVFVLGAVTLYLSRYILPEVLYPWLSVVSGLLVVVIGLSLLYRRLSGLSRSRGGETAHAHTHPPGRVLEHSHAHSADHEHTHSHGKHRHEHSPDHSHGHEHSHDHEHTHSDGGHGHSHLPPGADGSPVTWRSLVGLGVSGGLVPCPAALVLLLSAVSLGRLEFGMVLVVAFSVGLAIVLTGIGLLMIHARRIFERFSFEARGPRFLPTASAAIISLVGLGIMVGALGQTGIF